jgi:hypothetical protein
VCDDDSGVLRCDDEDDGRGLQLLHDDEWDAGVLLHVLMWLFRTSVRIHRGVR